MPPYLEANMNVKGSARIQPPIRLPMKPAVLLLALRYDQDLLRALTWDHTLPDIVPSGQRSARTFHKGGREVHHVGW